MHRQTDAAKNNTCSQQTRKKSCGHQFLSLKRRYAIEGADRLYLMTAEVMVKPVENTMSSINQSINQTFLWRFVAA